ncbi:MAG: hypothetical protein AMXMBFR33_46360 [Candidatus Xenobia bacterium]|jgi:Ca2+/Na+ antiporter
MQEFRFDQGGENVRRTVLMVLALFSFVATLGLLLVKFTHWLMLVVCPALVLLYMLSFFSYYRNRNDRIVLEGDQVAIYRAGHERRVARHDVVQAYHTGALLHITVKGQDPVQLPYHVERQDELLRALNSPTAEA